MDEVWEGERITLVTCHIGERESIATVMSRPMPPLPPKMMTRGVFAAIVISAERDPPEGRRVFQFSAR